MEGNPITYDRKQTMSARGPKVRLLDGLCKDAASQVLINEDGGKGSRDETGRGETRRDETSRDETGRGETDRAGIRREGEKKTP